MKPVVDGLENDYGKQVDFRRIDAGTQGGQAVIQAYGLRGHPSYVMLDSSGEVLWTGLGEQPAETLESQIRMILGDNPDQVISDYVDLVENLRLMGAEVEPGEEISQPFFSPRGQVVKINGEDVQVFEYTTEQGADMEAGHVSSDGSSIGTNMIAWIDAPHFYSSGRIIVLYVGNIDEVISILTQILGPQFAGK